MDPDRWRRIEDLFLRVLDMPPAERAAVMDAECVGDDDLRQRVECLLRGDEEPSDLLDDFEGLLDVERPDPMIGRELGEYRLISRIAKGGMGVVYKAQRTDGLFDQDVAIKLIRIEAATDEMLRRFDFERRALAMLNHPNIARLYAGGTTGNGSPYFVMELIHGAPIDQYCNEHRLTVADRLHVFTIICRAVHFAHQNLLVHRDLKPANILIDEQGVPKLLDFGIARLVQPQNDRGTPERTRTLARILTPEYASPEQLTGAAVTTATDVYSLGIVLYELLTGMRPFHCESRSPLEWEHLITEHPPTRPSLAAVGREKRPSGLGELGPGPEEFASRCGTTPARLRHQLGGDLDRIVLMALRKEPERRYASAQELAEDVERHLAGRPVHAREDSFLYRATRFVHRNRISVAAAALILLALVSGLFAARRGREHAQAEAAHARIEAESFHVIYTFLMDTFLTSGLFKDEDPLQGAREDILRQADGVRRQYPDQVHMRANLLDALGRICLLLDLFGESEELVREALEIREAEFGRQSLEVALSLGSLGELQFRSGAYAEAVESLRGALDLHRTCPLGTHTDIATAVNNLATALRATGAAEESERLHLEAIALRRATGDATLPLAESLNNLAGIHLDRGDYASARELLAEALAIRRPILGTEHPLTAQSLSNLAVAARRLGNIAEARTLLEEAEAGFRATRAKGRSGLARVLTSLATLDTEQGHLAGAEERLTRALEIQAERLGRDHPDIASVLSQLASLQYRQGRAEDAAASWEEVLRIRRAIFSPSNPTLGRTLQEYGVFLHNTGATGPAEAALREAIEILNPRASSNAPMLARAELSLGLCLLKQRRLDEAEKLLRTGAARLEQTSAVSEAETRAIREYLRMLEAEKVRADG